MTDITDKDDRLHRQLIQARLHVLHQEWNDARPLLEDLLARAPQSKKVQDLLLTVEKAQSVKQHEVNRSLDPGIGDGKQQTKNQVSAIVVALGLFWFVAMGSVRLAQTVYTQGWRSEVILDSGTTKSGRPYENKLPAPTVLILIPIAGISGTFLLRYGFHGFRIS